MCFISSHLCSSISRLSNRNFSYQPLFNTNIPFLALIRSYIHRSSSLAFFLSEVLIKDFDTNITMAKILTN